MFVKEFEEHDLNCGFKIIICEICENEVIKK